jgi:glycosyltransferase involved in cell wall biosynthesis
MTGPTPWASVVIPAHNEERVIGRCLTALQAPLGPGELEIVVVANGCDDATEQVARSVVPAVQVVSIPEASKTAALNAGDAVASVFPRAYVDADVEVGGDALRTVVEAMDESGVHCAAPRLHLDLAGRPWYVRLFFRAFQALPYGGHDAVANGMYVLSQEGRSRFGAFPDITADDLYVRNLFQPHERRAVPGTAFTVHPPKTLGGMLAIRERAYRGKQEYLARGFRSVGGPTFQWAGVLRRVRRDPAAMAVFIALNVFAQARLRLRRAADVWERDDSSRQ